MAKHNKKKPKRKVSNLMLVLICIMIIIYTASNFVLQYFTSVEVSPTLTNAWFAFWGTEIVALTAIKTVKVIKNRDSSDAPADEPIEDPANSVDISEITVDSELTQDTTDICNDL